MNLKKLQRVVSDDFYSCSLKNVFNVEAFVKVLAVLTQCWDRASVSWGVKKTEKYTVAEKK